MLFHRISSLFEWRASHQISYLYLSNIAQWLDCDSRCWEYHKVTVLARPAVSCSLCWHSERIQSSHNIRLFASLRSPAIWSYLLVSYYIGLSQTPTLQPSPSASWLWPPCRFALNLHAEGFTQNSTVVRAVPPAAVLYSLAGDDGLLTFHSCYRTGLGRLKSLFNCLWWPPPLTPRGKTRFRLHLHRAAVTHTDFGFNSCTWKPPDVRLEKEQVTCKILNMNEVDTLPILSLPCTILSGTFKSVFSDAQLENKGHASLIAKNSDTTQIQHLSVTLYLVLHFESQWH